MSHQDFSGDPLGTGSRKTAYHYRRGSSGASASSAANVGDDNPSQAGSSSPGLHHQQQQPQSQVSGAQVKKKSGFQITSVTSAQINVSGNNSLADDTESYDDMDESHTEDLSSDMLDVSVPRTAETGVPERSSSDETLNSLHGVDTPGLVSPNEPIHPHSMPQGSQPHTSMVNGTVHHQYYPQQHGHHHSSSLGGGEPSLSAPPLASSSPALVSKAGASQSQRQALLDNTKPVGGTNQPPAPAVGGTVSELHPQGGGNALNVSAVTGAAVPPAAFDIAGAAAASVGGGTGPSAAAAAAPSTQTHHTQPQTATGSRFRVVKLDTNSEPFRKGRWTCTEYYEKEVPQPAAAEASKGGDTAAESEAGNAAISQVAPAVQPPHTLQPYQQPSQDFTSPQAMQSPPQTTPLTSYVSPQEAVVGAHMQKPLSFSTATPQTAVSQHPAVVPQQLPYAVDPHHSQPQGSYTATPQLHTGVMGAGSGRQPDFIQPTAPFQTQVQPPLPLVTKGMSIAPVPGVLAPQPVNVTQQLPLRGQGMPPNQAAYAAQPQNLPTQPQPQIQAPAAAIAPGGPTHGIPSVPLTAVLQPLLTPGTSFTQVSIGGSSSRASQLEDAQKLLLQHQGLLSLPRFGMVTGGEGAAAAASPAGSLAHMGMSAEASAFMVAAAAGLRSQHAEGEEDR